jgi:2-keto-4-pentenoate hydratase/2-oxohepta-3-ene-1,7-dioic acid hydratase in catechol pathway
MVFYKTGTSLAGPGDTIVRPKATERLDAEGELVVVIKDRCRNVSQADALQHVLGYTCGNDVSARDWQRDDRNWWRAKSTDTFSPAGPVIETDIDPHNVRLTTRINGSEVQAESTNYLIFDIPTLVAFTSRFVTLEPGDMIYTGTPGEPGEMKGGDVCEVEIEGIGVLSNPVELER